MSSSLDRLTLLATFARIAERGSISAAARDLGLSQASASRQLQELERRLGVLLVQRTTHSLALTEAGTSFLLDARVLLENWDALVEEHAASDTGFRGRLKIVAPVALGQMHLAAAGLDFQQAHPGIVLNWLMQDDPIRFSEIGCDLWIKVGDISDDMLVVRQLAQVERLIVTSPDLAAMHVLRTPEDLADVPCAVLEPFEAGNIPLTATDGLVHTVKANMAFSTNNIFALHQAALRSVGYAVMPRWFVETDIAQGRLVDVLPCWRTPELAINVAFLPSRRQTVRLREFVDHISKVILQVPGVVRPRS